MQSNNVGVRSMASRAVAGFVFSLTVLGALVISPMIASAAMTGVTFSTVHAGQSTNCALSSTGTLYCWGANDYGQLLDGTTNDAVTPEALDLTSTLNGASIVGFANGSGTTCVLATGSKVFCWGYGGQGELGDGSFTLTDTPTQVTFTGLTGNITQIAGTGSTSFCVLTSTSQIWCWGGNVYGSLGNGTNTNSDVPVAVNRTGVLASRTLTTLSGSANTYCVLDGLGLAYCWGDGLDGALGNGSQSIATTPVAVDTSGALSGKTLVAIAPTSNHTCALDSSHQLYCWGTNNYGTNGLGDPDGLSNPSSAHLSPVHVSSMSSVNLTSVTSSGTESCAKSSSGALYCWGGQPIGDGYTINDALSPVQINGGTLAGKSVAQVSSGDYNTCAVDSDGSLYCWGIDDNNEIGDNSTATSYYPNEIAISPSASAPNTVPGAPRGVSATASDSTIQVNWTGPFNDGGASINSFTATATDGTNNFTCNGSNASATSCTIHSLVNGTSYNVTLVATNTNGDSSAVHINNVTPVALPDAPTLVSAVAGNQAIQVTWTPGASNGGASLSGFTATANLASTNKTCTGSGASATTCTISGLTNGSSYSVSVVATNSVGHSASSNSLSATPAAVPGAPSALVVTPALGSVAISWSAPTSNGGSAITGYTVTASPGGATCTTTTVLHCTISPLVETTAYSFSVKASNIMGAGFASPASIAVYPFSAKVLTIETLNKVVSKGATIKVILAGSNPKTKATVTLSTSSASCTFNAAHQCAVSLPVKVNGALRIVAKVGGTPATYYLWAPLVSAPTSVTHNKSFKVVVTFCVPSSTVILSFSDGVKVTVKATYQGIATAIVKLPKAGSITMTTNVSGIVVAPTNKIKVV
jgi:alpha-tubulin suppressor-like RCC1 family protein